MVADDPHVCLALLIHETLMLLLLLVHISRINDVYMELPTVVMMPNKLLEY